MKSFKKIALGVVAAMSISTLIATPASAATTTLTVGGTSVVATSVTPAELPVPADNNVHVADALKIALTGLDVNSVVSATVTGGKIVTTIGTDALPVYANTGSSTASISTGTGTSADFYVYTTSTSNGNVVVTIGGSTTTYYFKGLAGALNTIAVSAPTSSAAGTTEKIIVSGYDVFGNAKGGAVVNLQVITSTSSTTLSLTTDTATATIGTKSADVSIPASGTVTLVATATVAGAVTGLTAPVGVVVKAITIRDLAAELAAEKAARVADATKAAADLAKSVADLAAANAEIAKLKSDALVAKAASDKALADAIAAEKAASTKALADIKATYDTAMANAKAAADLASTTAKAEYNKLALAWNKAHPTKKVALKK